MFYYNCENRFVLHPLFNSAGIMYLLGWAIRVNILYLLKYVTVLYDWLMSINLILF